MTLIKSISGIRGTIGGVQGENLTPIDIVKFTSAYAAWLHDENPGRKLRVVVGRDARLSGDMVDSLVTGTLLGCGIDVIDVGLCTTPGVEVAVTAKKADGGIIITASHNPRQWNALKMLDGRGEFVNAVDGGKILAVAAGGKLRYVEIDHIGKVVERSDFNGEHIRRVLALDLVDVAAVKRQKYRIAVDGINSVGGVVIPRLLEEMGVDVIRVNCEPTGEFAHDPEPIARNLTEICDVVVREKADMGIVVDPDVDRLAFVMEDGRLFGEEYTLVAVADYVLSKSADKLSETVSNLSSTRALSDITKRYGGEYFASAVGEVNVVEEMKRVGAVIGGEGNGGVIYPELHYGRDALVGVALFLTHMAHSGKTISGLRSTYPDYFISKNKLELTPEMDVDMILKKVKERYSVAGDGKVIDIDGVKIDFPDGWVHLRRSNTEPIIRIYSESRDEAAAKTLAAKIMGEIKKLIKQQ